MEKIQGLAVSYALPITLSLTGLLLIGISTLITPLHLINNPKAASSFVLVDLKGQVKNPGLYKLKSGTTIGEAIKLSGGLTEAADVAYISKQLNLAKMVSDGDKVFIPAQNEVFAETKTSHKVNINSAAKEQLVSLDGIGEVTAQKIIDNRPYFSIEELLNKKVVGRSVYAKISQILSVN